MFLLSDSIIICTSILMAVCFVIWMSWNDRLMVASVKSPQPVYAIFIDDWICANPICTHVHFCGLEMRYFMIYCVKYYMYCIGMFEWHILEGQWRRASVWYVEVFISMLSWIIFRLKCVNVIYNYDQCELSIVLNASLLQRTSLVWINWVTQHFHLPLKPPEYHTVYWSKAWKARRVCVVINVDVGRTRRCVRQFVFKSKEERLLIKNSDLELNSR